MHSPVLRPPSAAPPRPFIKSVSGRYCPCMAAARDPSFLLPPPPCRVVAAGSVWVFKFMFSSCGRRESAGRGMGGDFGFVLGVVLCWEVFFFYDGNVFFSFLMF